MSTSISGASAAAARYATALFDLAEDGGELDATAGDVSTVRGLLAESGDLRRVVASPVIGRDTQAAALDAVLERAGAGALVRRFVGTVARNRRLHELDAMCAAYGDLLARRRNEATARVTTARPLTDGQLGELEDELRRATGARVTVDAHVDPGILGGMVVRIGSRMVDSSLATRLQRLELSLKGTA